MKWIVPLHQIRHEDRNSAGEECVALALMAQDGFNIPETACLTTEVYEAFVTHGGLREAIFLELTRKDLEDVRWEESWDASLRIRNMFLSKQIPEEIGGALRSFLRSRFGSKAVAVRASPPCAIAPKASFRGLHESFADIRGVDSILECVQLVWASLWSAAALLYRRELGLDVDKSSMAVVLQGMVAGERSGVIFSRNPDNPSQAVVESVHGLSRGLSEGIVEPDRWVIDRSTKKIIFHRPVERRRFMVSGRGGVRIDLLPASMAGNPPLTEREVLAVFALANKAELLFGGAREMQWTFKKDVLWVLRSSPITTPSNDTSEDKRHWYLSLRRSFENLKALERRIERVLIPAMIEDAALMAEQDLTRLTDEELGKEIKRRGNIENNWVKTYWNEFIPFAHGVRLFGQVYNDAVRPEDPYEFVDLLASTGMVSLKRNRMLEGMAEMVRNDESLAGKLIAREYADAGEGFLSKLDVFIKEFGDLSCPVTGVVQCGQAPESLIGIILEMAAHPPVGIRIKTGDLEGLRERFLNRFEGRQRAQAAELLDLARRSYQLRDDDNIHLARIEARKLAAIDEGKRRLRERGELTMDAVVAEEIAKTHEGPQHFWGENGRWESEEDDFRPRPRQLRGQPASKGISRGRARVILSPSDLSQVRHGDVVVFDVVDPNMTFVVPLAAGLVERRGGMLVHGAVIAREYGIPCVTGISNATLLIRTGDHLTVDGYLGIVTIGEAQLSAQHSPT